MSVRDDRAGVDGLLRRQVEGLGLYDACLFEADGATVCAFVPPPGDATAEDAAIALVQAFGASGRSIATLAVRRIPRTAEGIPDRDNLRGVWQQRDPISAALPTRLHLWDAGLAPRLPRRIDLTHRAPEQKRDGTPSILRGPLLVLPPDATMTLPERLVTCAESGGRLTWIDRRGVVREIAYVELLVRARTVAASLARRGVRPGERVMVIGPDGIDLFTALWACLWGGFVACPYATPKRLAADDGDVARIAALTHRLGIRTILTGAGTDLAALRTALGNARLCLDVGALAYEMAPAVDAAPADPGNVAFLFFTSGSTGLPKAVMLTHSNLLSMAEGIRVRHGFGPADPVLNWMPLEHIGVQGMLATVAIVTGASQIHVDTVHVLADPLRWLDLIDRYRVAYGWAPHFAFALIGDAAEAARTRRWDLSCVKRLLNAGEVVLAGGVRRFLDVTMPHGLRPEAIGPSWGMSETASSFLLADGVDPAELPTDPHATLDVGTPHPGGEARLVDADGTVVPEGVQGSLEVRGPQVNVGYDQDPEATAASRDAAGWFRTGDRGRIVAGRMVITGRDKEVVILRGQNYAQQALESVVETVPGVSRSFVAAIGVPGDATGTEALAILYHADQDTPGMPGAIGDALRRDFSVTPDFVIHLAREAFPKTAIGKIQRGILRDRFIEGAFHQQLVARDLSERNARTLPAWFFVPHWHPFEGWKPNSDASRVVMIDRDPDPAAIAGLCRDLAERPQDVTLLVGGRDSAARPEAVPGQGARGLAAALRCLLAETDGLRLRLLHLPPALAADREAAEALAARMPFADRHSALRMEAIVHQGHLWTYGLTPMPLIGRVPVAPAIGTDGFILLVGGGGRIGPAVERHLRQVFGLPVLVTSRGANPEHPERIVMDPADPLSIRSALTEGARRIGAAVRAIVHLGGSTRIGVPLAAEDKPSFADHFHGKLEAALALRAALAEAGGGLLVLFSSVNADLGGFGAGAYAAANAAMHQATVGEDVRWVRIVTLAWSLWETRACAPTGAGQRRGFLPLPVEQAVLSMTTALHSALQHGLDHVLIGLDGSHPSIAPLLDCGPVLAAAVERTPGDDAPVAFSELEERVAEIWSKVLGRSSRSPSDNFFDLGGDSLLLARLHEGLSLAFGCEIPLGDLFRHTTVRDQAGLIQSARGSAA